MRGRLGGRDRDQTADVSLRARVHRDRRAVGAGRVAAGLEVEVAVRGERGTAADVDRLRAVDGAVRIRGADGGDAPRVDVGLGRDRRVDPGPDAEIAGAEQL